MRPGPRCNRLFAHQAVRHCTPIVFAILAHRPWIGELPVVDELAMLDIGAGCPTESPVPDSLVGFLAGADGNARDAVLADASAHKFPWVAPVSVLVAKFTTQAT